MAIPHSTVPTPIMTGMLHRIEPTFFTSTVLPSIYNFPTNASNMYANTTIMQTTISTIKKTSNSGGFESDLIIPLYVIIFILSMLGNSLVLITLAQNRRMRTVTNVFLLNLAVSDLLLGVFCMPFTLVGQVLRNFIFGHLMCKLIPYFQAVSVSVGVWTLVAISLERYFAICRPLKSRRWQTRFHAYKMIGVVWLGSLVWNLPILVVSKLKAMREKGRNKCREEWPTLASERSFNISLDLMLLVVPLLVMALAYALIVSKLWKGLRREIEHNQHQRFTSLVQENGTVSTSLVDNTATNMQRFEGTSTTNHGSIQEPPAPTISTTSTNQYRTTGYSCGQHFVRRVMSAFRWGKPEPEVPLTSLPTQNISIAENTTTYTFGRHTAIRSTYMDKSIESKKKVIRMLFVIVLEFFVCWTPLHVLNTWYLFHPEAVYKAVGSTGVSLVQLLAYISSCCNPITYCFMNKKFRQAFLGAFDCFKQKTSLSLTNRGSEISANDSGPYAGRASTVAKSLGVMQTRRSNSLNKPFVRPP